MYEVNNNNCIIIIEIIKNKLKIFLNENDVNNDIIFHLILK